jgi:vacuolar-type H+-ATPase subunit I/STV1
VQFLIQIFKSPNYFFKSLELNEDSKNLLTSEVAVKLPHRYQRLLKDLSEGRNAAREGLISELNSKLKASEKLLVDLESRIKNFDQKNPAILALKKEIEDLKKFASNNDFDTWFMGGVTSVGILLLYEWFVDDSKVDKKIEELQNKIKELEKEKEIRH